MPGRVRCDQCGQIWPGLARFCGRCGQVLRTVHEYDALDPDAEDYTRSRRRVTRLLVLALLGLIIIAVVTAIGGEPEAPVEDPLIEPQLQASLPVPA